MIKRDYYLDKLISYKDQKIIKIITGIRRCGKSTLLKLFNEYLTKSNIDDKHIIFINFEDLSNEKLYNYIALYNHLEKLIVDNEQYYILLDEIQNVKDFQKAINSIYLKNNVDIYITGSNAYMLSSEIATLLSGRYIQINMLPFSYKEYLESTRDIQSNNSFNDYITNSSFPQVTNFIGNKELIDDYIENLFNTIIVKDIFSRNTINDILIFKSVLSFIFDNIGSVVSSKKIADTLTSNGRKIDPKTVEKYINAMINCYLVYQIKRYDTRGKNYLKSQEKYYMVDLGFRHALITNNRMDMGHILENIVFLELYRRGYKIYVGKLNEYEIDFVVHKGDEKKYFQVASTIRNENTYKREIKPLKMLMDNYEKIILTLDDDINQNDEGIKIINIQKWLLN